MSTGKILGGVLVGLGAIAAAPFTGGGSLFAAGVSLSAALAGSSVGLAAAVGGGIIGGATGAGLSYKESQHNKNRNEHHFNEGVKAGGNRVKEKFTPIIKVQKERDELMLLCVKIGVYVSKIDGVIDPQELAEIDKLCMFINENPTTPEFLKKEIQRIIKSNIAFSQINEDVDRFLMGKSKKDRTNTLNFFTRFIETIINADKEVHPKEDDFLKRWKRIHKN